MSHKEQIARYHIAMANLGFSYDESEQIRRSAQTLERWNEAECNGDVERDEATGKTYRTWNHNGPGPIKHCPCPDRETGAIKRIRALAESRGLKAMFQGDPRGWPVQICKPEDVQSPDNYRGIGVPVR